MQGGARAAAGQADQIHRRRQQQAQAGLLAEQGRDQQCLIAAVHEKNKGVRGEQQPGTG